MQENLLKLYKNSESLQHLSHDFFPHYLFPGLILTKAVSWEGEPRGHGMSSPLSSIKAYLPH